MKKTIVVSAVNLKNGGTLAILRECLQYLSGLSESDGYRIIALVYKKELVLYPNIRYIEMQWPKKLWINRLWCEYVTMRKISKKLSPVCLWLSLHDTTPNVTAERRAVYCHNSFPFYEWKLRELWFAPKIVMLALLSRYTYKKNIHDNAYVIVQQEWMKREFVRLFKLKEGSVIVAPPRFGKMEVQKRAGEPLPEGYSFLFAAKPDSHKNFECICQATDLSQKKMGIEKFKVYITVKGDENRYAKWLYHKWGTNVPALEFTGFLDKNSLYEYYRKCNCLIFPSKVETWGLPVTEFGCFDKPMLLADLPYAHETAGGLKKVAFFNPDNPQELAGKMVGLIHGDDTFLTTIGKRTISSPVAWSWQELFNLLLI